MRKFKNNYRAELVDSYKKGWQRAVQRYEEQHRYILINQRRCHPPTADRPGLAPVCVALIM